MGREPALASSRVQNTLAAHGKISFGLGKALFAWLWLAVASACGPAFGGSEALVPAIGLNKFDLFMQYLGTASGGDGSPGYRKVTRAMARKAITDARNIGVTYFRISASGYAPSGFGRPGDIDLWGQDRKRYWALFDTMMDDLSANDMRMIPVFVWNWAQLPAMRQETVPEMLRDPESQSWSLLADYVTEFVLRYKSHPALYFYELTNEMNNGADLDLVTRCRAERGGKDLSLCEPRGNFSTDDMVMFTSRLASLIRELDPSRPISSGFSVPRPAAGSLRRKPEWITGHADWTPDSREDFERNLLDIHRGVDVISVHLYPRAENRRFGANDATELLDSAKAAADKAGKPIFVGEFGDPNVLIAEPGSFAEKMLDKIVALRVPLSALWVWEFYSTAPYLSHDNQHTAFSLEPGFTDRLISKIQEANRRLGNRLPVRTPADRTPPNVVLTWPLECTLVKRSQQVCAVASDDSGAVANVEFRVAGRLATVKTGPPYCFALQVDQLPTGEVPLVARAIDGAGNVAEFAATIIVRSAGESAGTCGAANAP